MLPSASWRAGCQQGITRWSAAWSAADQHSSAVAFSAAFRLTHFAALGLSRLALLQVGCYDGTVALCAVQPRPNQPWEPAVSDADLAGNGCHGLTLLLHFAASRDPVRAVAWAPPSPEPPEGPCPGRLFAVAGQGQGVNVWDAR